MLGKKIGMTQVYGDDGVIVPVTVIECGPCVVLQVRTQDRDGYDAVQVGFGDVPRGKAPRSVRGHVAALSGRRRESLRAAGVELLPKAECEPKRFVREFRLDSPAAEYSVGQVLLADSLADVNWVDVISVSKGRGTTGVMRRHNFAGQPASHGAKRVHRHGGSIGQSADPSRVLRGTKMPGRYGCEQITVKNLKLVRTDVESNVILVRGAVSGPVGGLVVVRRSAKNK